MYKGKKIGVAVPAYNEEELIGRTIEEMPDFVDRIYVVDDASTDGTADVVRRIMEKDKRVVLIHHERNQGVGGAIVSGWRRALKEGMDIVAVMAGDNQMDPAYLQKLLDPIVAGRADMAKGTRFHGRYWKGMPKVRVFGTFLLNILTKIASGYWNINDPQNGYVAVSADALRKLDLDSLVKGYAFENDVLIKANVAGLRVIHVPVRIRYKVGERSRLSILRFTCSTSLFLLKSFLWRVWITYMRRGHPLGFLYYAGTAFIASFFVLLVFSVRYALYSLGVGVVLLASACAVESRRFKR